VDVAGETAANCTRGEIDEAAIERRLILGLCLSVTTALQVIGIDVLTDAVYMLPFLVVMVALVVFARRAYLPAALRTPYRREER
jgi:ABC-type uncharacterized transport system permease subunit